MPFLSRPPYRNNAAPINTVVSLILPVYHIRGRVSTTAPSLLDNAKRYNTEVAIRIDLDCVYFRVSVVNTVRGTHVIEITSF